VWVLHVPFELQSKSKFWWAVWAVIQTCMHQMWREVCIFHDDAEGTCRLFCLLVPMFRGHIAKNMKWDPWFWSDMSCITYKDITRSRLNSFTVMDLIHLLLFFIMKTKMILILKLLFSWSCLIEIIIVMLHVDSCYYSSSK